MMTMESTEASSRRFGVIAGFRFPAPEAGYRPGRWTGAPMSGAKRPAPVAGGRFPAPVAGGRFPAPVAGSRRPVVMAGGR
jgi:hypothetical protein